MLPRELRDMLQNHLDLDLEIDWDPSENFMEIYVTLLWKEDVYDQSGEIIATDSKAIKL